MLRYEEDWVTSDDANNIHKGDKPYFCLAYVDDVASPSREIGIHIHRLVEEPTEVDEYDFNTVYA